MRAKRKRAPKKSTPKKGVKGKTPRKYKGGGKK